VFTVLERFLNECGETKPKVIIPAHHNKHKLPNEPTLLHDGWPSEFINIIQQGGQTRSTY